MNEFFKEILFQALGYGVSILLAFFILTVILRGFLLKYIRVRASLGRLVLIKIRGVTTWSYEVGKFNEGDLVFGKKKERKRINNIKPEYIYRSIGINFIDVDGEKWAILPPHNTEGVPGFDPEKQESLVTRALYKPSLNDPKIQIALVLLVIAIVVGGVGAYFGYNILNNTGFILDKVGQCTAGAVVPA